MQSLQPSEQCHNHRFTTATCISLESSNRAAPAPAGPGFPLAAPSNSCTQRNSWLCNRCQHISFPIKETHLTVAAQSVPVGMLPRASAMQERLIPWLELSQQPCQVAWKQHPCLQNKVKLLLQFLSAALYSLMDAGWIGSLLRCADPAY